MNSIEDKKIEELINILVKARDNFNVIFIMGNGGSASTASHFVGDLSKGAIAKDKSRFKAIGLTDNIPNMTQWGNDVSYSSIFVEQLKNLLEYKNIVIGISGSGESKNIINAINYANTKGAFTIGISGYSKNNSLNKVSKFFIHIPTDTMQIFEDISLILEHMITLIISKGDHNDH